MNELDFFDPSGGTAGFDKQAIKQRDFPVWSARWLMSALGYADFGTFQKVINKAKQVCLTLDIELETNFQKIASAETSDNRDDILLSRFACYLTTMHADPRKHEVARAQRFFATTIEAVRQYVSDAEDIERVSIRQDLSEHDKALSSTAKAHGVENYAFFLNKGYLGMYNMQLSRLKTLKGVPDSRPLFDFMGKEELAANLFRVTQTEAKIRNENIRGQNRLETTAYSVGQKVRQTMVELSGNAPEQLPAAQDIKIVRSGLKKANRALRG
jgi:DNA-damage-inducible protein D